HAPVPVLVRGGPGHLLRLPGGPAVVGVRARVPAGGRPHLHPWLGRDRPARRVQRAQRRPARVQPGGRDALAAHRLGTAGGGLLPAVRGPPLVAAAVGLSAGAGAYPDVHRGALPDRRVRRLGVRGGDLPGGRAGGAVVAGARRPAGGAGLTTRLRWVGVAGSTCLATGAYLAAALPGEA